VILRKEPVVPGDRFRDLQTRLFGTLAIDWIVDDVFTGTDGVAYAHLTSAADVSRRKTLSLAVLNDRRSYVRIDVTA
jgi:hypothetical protein